MRNLQVGRLSLLVQRHPGNSQLAEDVKQVLEEVPDDEDQDQKVGREAAEERVLMMMRVESGELWPNRPFIQESSPGKDVDFAVRRSSWEDGLHCGVSSILMRKHCVT